MTEPSTMKGFMDSTVGNTVFHSVEDLSGGDSRAVLVPQVIGL